MTVNVGACPVDICHDTKACVPVTINTFAEAGEPIVECCDSPEIKPGSKCCGCKEDCKCEFTVTQTMRIQLPLFFGADIGVGEACIEAGGTSALSNGECSSCTRHECECIEEECKTECCDDETAHTDEHDADKHDIDEYPSGYTLIP